MFDRCVEEHSKLLFWFDLFLGNEKIALRGWMHYRSASFTCRRGRQYLQTEFRSMSLCMCLHCKLHRWTTTHVKTPRIGIHINKTRTSYGRCCNVPTNAWLQILKNRFSSCETRHMSHHHLTWSDFVHRCRCTLFCHAVFDSVDMSSLILMTPYEQNKVKDWRCFCWRIDSSLILMDLDRIAAEKKVLSDVCIMCACSIPSYLFCVLFALSMIWKI